MIIVLWPCCSEPRLAELEHDVLPRLRELRRWQQQWQRASLSHTDAQRQRLHSDGYAFLTPEQLALVYGSPCRCYLN